MDRREARRAFKLKITPKGVYAVKCTVSGETWVGASTHLDSQQNSAWYQLRNRLHMNKRMQAAWDAHGEAAFTYQILETVDDDVAPLLLRDLLAEREKHWERALAASTAR